MDQLPATPEPSRRPVPKKVKTAIAEIIEGRARTVTAAAKKAGLSRERLSRALSEPHIAEYLREKAARAVALGAGRAAARLVGLLDAKSEHVSLDAARHTLAVAGIRPAADAASVNVNVNIRAGYVIDLSGRNRPPRSGEVIIAGPDAPALPSPPPDEQ